MRETVVRAKMMTRVWLFREGGTRTERADLDETRNVFARERALFAGGGGVCWGCVVYGLPLYVCVCLCASYAATVRVVALLSVSSAPTTDRNSVVVELRIGSGLASWSCICVAVCVGG